MPEWFSEWQGWLSLAIMLGIAEMFSLDLVLLMLAVGALVGMAAALVGLGIGFQVLLASGAAIAMLAVVRPNLARRLHSGPDLQLGHGKLVGRQAIVTQEISANAPGRIRLAGEIWSAEPYDETLVIADGETVDVLEIKGATAYVHPVPRLNPGPGSAG